MPTLHMEVEACRTTQQSLSNASDQLDNLFKSVINSVSGLQAGAWVGNSANEFFEAVSQWQTNIAARVEELRNLQSRLASEISEWENMAQKLG